jgi:hypothetical protein
MEYTYIDLMPGKKGRLIKILWILFPVIFIPSIISLSEDIGPFFIGLILLIISMVDLAFIYLMTEKYYNWPMIFVLIFLLGFLFKRQHWPMAGALLTIGICFLCITSLVNAIRFQITMKHNPFLRWFGSVSCIIISTYMLGWLIMIQHWSREVGDILGYTGVVLFIISILGLVFTLPGSNYLGWSIKEKKIFFRAILIPMGIVFCLIIITFIFSDVFFWILNKNDPAWDLSGNIELLNLEGINQLK